MEIPVKSLAMITFFICLVLLVTAYFTYGRYLERVCRIDPAAAVPSERLRDGVDYVPMPLWRTFLIQLLNIAGIGPIFGAIMGACFGPVAFLWITFGGIFMGAMHDFISGVILVRNDGLSIPEVIGRYLGGGARQFMRVFSVLLLILVGVVFLRSPASILGEMIPAVSYWWWVAIIVIYYFVATLLPIDKVIGKIYPLFGAALIFMALGLLGVIVFGKYEVPEMTTFRNFQIDAHALPIVPTLFITIACGAISGFHATQSPLMARCVNNERECRTVFYGAMITEGIVAMIWAAAAIKYAGSYEGLQEMLASSGSSNPAVVVNFICNDWMGRVGAILAILGVVAAPVTSGDTAFRCARLIASDILKLRQDSLWRRLAVSLPMFAIAVVLMNVNFDILWRYFAWFNQTLSIFTFWALTVWLARNGKNFCITLLPAMFMTAVCTAYIMVAPEGFRLPQSAGVAGGIAAALVLCMLFIRWLRLYRTNRPVA